MNTIDAAHKTVRAYPGGSESLGPRIGMSPALLRSKVNPNNTTHHLTLVEAGEIMSVTDDHQILHAMAAEQGYTLQLIDAVPGGDLMRTLLHANAVEGDFDRILQVALEDNIITANELGAINAAGAKQNAATLMLLAKLRAMCEQGRAAS